MLTTFSVTKEICHLAAFRPNLKIGVILPSSFAARDFRQLLEHRSREIPSWILEITKSNARGVKFNNRTSIQYIHTLLQAKGCTFDALFISNKVPNEQISEYIFPLIAMFSKNNPIVYFDD